MEKKEKSDVKGVVFPMTDDGRSYTCETKKGEVANRCIFVGDLQRAGTIASFLEGGGNFDRTSGRYTRTITGVYKRKSDGKKVPITVMGIGIGPSMMDLALRECRAMVIGEMSVIRLGTCGCLKPSIPLGDIIVSDASVKVYRNPNAYGRSNISVGTNEYFHISDPITGDENLTKLLYENLKKEVTGGVHFGWNGTCDSFYSSQGRVLTDFRDHNETIIEDLMKKFPKMATLEMETFHLYDLARCATIPMYTSAAVISLAQRATKEFLKDDLKNKREKEIGLAALETLANFPLNEESFEDTEDVKFVWNQ